MRTETFSTGDIVCTVRTATRRTPILAAQYKEILRKTFPALVEYETALMSLVAPKDLFTMPDEKAPTPQQRQLFLERRQQDYELYWGKVVAVQREFSYGYEIAKKADLFCITLSRVEQVDNLITGVRIHTFTTDEVLQVFNYFLDDDDEDTNSFWNKLVIKINEVDTPLVPVEDRKPTDLTEQERADPLSVAEGTNGRQ